MTTEEQLAEIIRLLKELSTKLDAVTNAIFATSR